MAPPPATPTPHRFLVPKRSQPKTETPKAFQSGGQQFRNTPRFSLHSTPRGAPGGGGAGPSSSIPTPGPARSGAPSFIRPTPRATDPIHDVIDSSPPFVEQAGGDGGSVHRGDPIEVFDDAVPESSPIGVGSETNDYEHNHYNEESSESEADLRHRSPKRRRISISSDFSSDAHPSPQHHLDHDLTMHDATPPPLLDPYSSQPLSPVTINPRSPASAQQQPTFLKAPRFKPAEAAATEPEELLRRADPPPDVFSPHRGRGKGARYAPGGLAAEVRDWFVDAWAGASVAAEAAARRAGGGDGGASWNGNGEWVARIRVEEVREASGMALVVGRSVGVEEVSGKGGGGGDGDDDGDGKGVERGNARVRSMRMVLAGSPRITGLEKRQDVRPGVVVGVGRPTWDISLPDQGRWNVVCEWAILH